MSTSNPFARPVARSAFSFPAIPGWAQDAITDWLQQRHRCGRGATCHHCLGPAIGYWRATDGDVVVAGGFQFCMVAKERNTPSGKDLVTVCRDCGRWAEGPDGVPERYDPVDPARLPACPSVSVVVAPNGEVEAVDVVEGAA